MNENSFPEIPLVKKLNEMADSSLRKKPKRWDVWFFFTKYLCIEVFGNGFRGRGYFNRDNSTPYHTGDWDYWMKLGDYYLSTEELNLHRTTITTKFIDHKGLEQSCVFAFMTSNSSGKAIKELIIEVKPYSFVKCFCLWGEFAVFPDTLIKWRGSVNRKSSKVTDLIRQLLPKQYWF